MNIEDKIKDLILTNYITMKRFCNEKDLKTTTIETILKRGITTGNCLTVCRICEALNIDFYSLMEGRIEEKPVTNFPMTTEEKKLIEDFRILDDFGIEVVKTVCEVERDRNIYYANNIPFVWKPSPDLGVAAGFGQTINDYNKMVKIPKTRIAESADFVVRIDGNSMFPEYENGDFVLVRSQPDIDLNQIGIFILNNEGYIKQKGNNQLLSLNPDYPPIEIQAGDTVYCCGLVLEKCEVLDEE